MNSPDQPRLTKGEQTKRKLLESAKDLFSTDWYESVSIAQICRNANLSNGIFYRYYTSKEEVFLLILDELIHELNESLTRLDGEDVRQRLTSFYTILAECAIRFSREITIYREGEFRLPEYDRKLHQIYRDALKQVYLRDVSVPEYIYLTGGMRFISNRVNTGTLKAEIVDLVDIACDGLFPSQDVPDVPLLKNPEYEPVVTGEGSKAELLKSGIELIGSKGYYNAEIYEIAKNAGFSVGSFYKAFDTKEQFLSQVLGYISRNLRHHLMANRLQDGSRLERELYGWKLYLDYFEDRSHFYQIIREAEFVNKDLANNYYDLLVKSYIKDLDTITFPSRVIAANYLVGIGHHLGVELFFSKSIEDINPVLNELGRLLVQGAST